MQSPVQKARIDQAKLDAAFSRHRLEIRQRQAETDLQRDRFLRTIMGWDSFDPKPPLPRSEWRRMVGRIMYALVGVLAFIAAALA